MSGTLQSKHKELTYKIMNKKTRGKVESQTQEDEVQESVQQIRSWKPKEAKKGTPKRNPVADEVFLAVVFTLIVCFVAGTYIINNIVDICI